MKKPHDEDPALQREALERALRHIGEPVDEADIAAFVSHAPARQAPDAPKRPTPRVTRRRMLAGIGMAGAAGAAAMMARAAAATAPPGAVEYPVPEDSTRVPGRMMGEDGGYGTRSQFETEVRWSNPTRSA